MHHKNVEQLEKLLRLRLAVAAVGEKAKWWPSHICDPLRLKALRQLFPKTWRLAAFSAVSDAAKIVHREALSNRAQHLFRFQTEIEQDMRRYLGTSEGKAIFDEVMQAPETTLERLSEKGFRARAGAYELGDALPEVIYQSTGRMATLYWEAYKAGSVSFPYFLPRQGEN